MESDESQHFNERLSHWVASQGFWFQLRYSLTGSGMAGTKGFHLMGLGLRLLVFLLLGVAAAAIFLVTRVGSEEFTKALEERIGAGLRAGETRIKGLDRADGGGMISRMASTGGNRTFFSALEARNVRFKMGLFDGILGRSDPGTVTVTRLDVDLHAGADDKEAAENIGKALFGDAGGQFPSRFDIEDATLRWGYAGTPRGAVENTHLRIQKLPDGWRMVCVGGAFSQNWLRKLEIVSLVAVCSPTGIVFEEAVFKKGQGTVELKDLRVRAGEQPAVEGRAILKRFPLDSALPVAARHIVEGSISGGFKISGSTNTEEGIVFDGAVSLEEGDLIRLKDRLHLLRALSVAVAYHNYRRVDFHHGSFRLKTSGESFELQDLKLDGKELMTVEGGMKARPASNEERRETSEVGPVSPLFATGLSDDADVLTEEDTGFTLRRAAKAAGAGGPDSAESASSAFDQVGQTLAARPWIAPEQLTARPLRYEGSFDITLPPDAFERAPTLRELYPGAGPAGRVPLKVPVEGGFHQLTLDQAETIYRQRRGSQ